MENQIEIWKDIPDYVGIYQVSNLGRVKSFHQKNSRILSPGTSLNEYSFVHLYKKSNHKSFRVHQLVAIAFLNHKICRFDFVVDHIDNNKYNNNVDNLQIVTNRFNSTKDKKPKSGHSCIYFNSNSWLVRMRVNGVKKSVGTFKKIEDAVYYRDLFIKNLHNK